MPKKYNDDFEYEFDGLDGDWYSVVGNFAHMPKSNIYAYCLKVYNKLVLF